MLNFFKDDTVVIPNAALESNTDGRNFQVFEAVPHFSICEKLWDQRQVSLVFFPAKGLQPLPPNFYRFYIIFPAGMARYEFKAGLG
ncbi:MAG: hypothetical protein WD077_08050 [Bacteroidia bacterium]